MERNVEFQQVYVSEYRKWVCKSVKDSKSEVKTILQQPANIQERMLCVICLDAEKSVVLLPCKHLCMCRPCMIKLFNIQKKCPICRECVRISINVYI